MKIFDILIVTQKFAEKAEIFLKRSLCFSSLGEYQNAIEDLKKCVQLAPWNVDARIKLADTWVLLEEYRKAINVCFYLFESLINKSSPKHRLLMMQMILTQLLMNR